MIQKEILHNQQKIKEIAFIKRELDFAEIEAVLKLNKILVLI
jgi:hypothetical protein